VHPVSSFAVDKDIKNVEQKVKQHVATTLPAARVIYGAGAAVGTNSADVDVAIAAILKVGSVALKRAGMVVLWAETGPANVLGSLTANTLAAHAIFRPKGCCRGQSLGPRRCRARWCSVRWLQSVADSTCRFDCC